MSFYLQSYIAFAAVDLCMCSQDDLLLYGVDIDGSISTENDSEAVAVPATASPLQPHYFQVLQQELQPHEASWDNIVHIYAATRTFVQIYSGVPLALYISILQSTIVSLFLTT